MKRKRTKPIDEEFAKLSAELTTDSYCSVCGKLTTWNYTHYPWNGKNHCSKKCRQIAMDKANAEVPDWLNPKMCCTSCGRVGNGVVVDGYGYCSEDCAHWYRGYEELSNE